MVRLTKGSPNAVCFRRLNQRSSNAAMMNRRRSKAGDSKVVSIEPKKVDEEEERVDEEDPKDLFLEFVKAIGNATSGVLKESFKGLSSMSGNLNASSYYLKTVSKKQVVGKEEVDEEDPNNLFSKFVKVIGQSTSSVWKAASKGSSMSSGDLKASSDLKVVSKKPNKNLFSKFVQVIGQSTSGVWKAASKGSSMSSGDLKASGHLLGFSRKPTKVFVEQEEVDGEYSNLFLKVVKVIGKGTSGIRLVYEPEPALNLATYRGDRRPFVLWCVRGSGLFRKYAFFKMKFFGGLSLMFTGVGTLIVLGDKYDELEASDSDSD